MSESVANEVLKLANVTRQAGEAEQPFLVRVVRAANEVLNRDKNDETWETLSEPTQNWINECVTALASKDKPPLPPLPGLEAVLAVEVSQEEAKPAAKKKAKPAAKPKKSAKSNGNGARRGPKGRFPASGKIKVLTKGNPYREGTKSAAWFEIYSKNLTLEQALEAGVARRHLCWAVDHQYLKIG